MHICWQKYDTEQAIKYAQGFVYFCFVLFINPLRAKLFRGNINIYLHFVSFLHIDETQVVETLHQIRQEPTHST